MCAMQAQKKTAAPHAEDPPALKPLSLLPTEKLYHDSDKQ
jgi:hypothetical protein